LDVDATAVAGTWFRHVPAGVDAHHRPLHPADNRWQRGEVVDALYFADSEATAWAEWYRFLAEAGLPPRQALPRDLWRWRIKLPGVADLSDDARLARAGLPPLSPTRAQWAACQAVGERLHGDGWPALVSASAARPEGRALCVFRTAHRVPGTWPVRPPTRVSDPPVVPAGLRT
jgi:RES domain-containing protein